MPNPVALIAPLALLLSPSATQQGAGEGPGPIAHEAPPTAAQPLSAIPADWLSLLDPTADQSAAQVRIERRVILRISPRPAPSRRNLMSEMPGDIPMSRIVERPAGKCLKVGAIAGAQPERGGRLMLFMRDRRIIAADLERACSARDFYSGFYLEPNEDGMLCIQRDRLQSRSGAKCQVARLRELLVEED